MRVTRILLALCSLLVAADLQFVARAEETGECVSANPETGECMNPDAIPDAVVEDPPVVEESTPEEPTPPQEEVATETVEETPEDPPVVEVAAEELPTESDAVEEESAEPIAEETSETVPEDPVVEEESTTDEPVEEQAAEQSVEEVSTEEPVEEEVAEQATEEETAEQTEPTPEETTEPIAEDETVTATDATEEQVEEAKEEESSTPGCPSRKHVIKCAGQYLDTNGNNYLERAELQAAIDKLPWFSRGILSILGSVDKMMTKCDIDKDGAIGIEYDMTHNAETCLATCFKRRAFKAAFFPDCEA